MIPSAVRDQAGVSGETPAEHRCALFHYFRTGSDHYLCGSARDPGPSRGPLNSACKSRGCPPPPRCEVCEVVYLNLKLGSTS